MLDSLVMLLLGATLAILGIVVIPAVVQRIENHRADMRELAELRREKASLARGYW